MNMKMYVLQVRSGNEISAFYALKRQGFDVVLPTMQEYIHKNGNWDLREKIIFTQYLFIKFEPSEENYYQIKKIDGFVKFLGYQQPLTEREQKYIEWLANNGKPITPSKIYVTANGDKMILSGILREYSGTKIDYDLRQRKASIIIKIADKLHKITLPVVRI